MYFVVFFPPFFRSDVMPEGLSHLTMDNVQVYFQRMEGVFVYNFCHWKYCYVLINYRFCVLSLHYTHNTYPFWTFGFFPSLSIPYHLEHEYDLTCLLIFITEVFKICHKLMCACSLKFLLIMSHHGSHVLCAHSRARIVWLVKFCKVLLQIRAHLCSKAFLGSFSPFYMEHPIIKLLTKRIILNFLWNLSDLKSDFTLTLGYLNPALNNPALNNFLPRAFCLSSTVWLLNLVAGSEIQTKDVLKPKFH